MRYSAKTNASRRDKHTFDHPVNPTVQPILSHELKPAASGSHHSCKLFIKKVVLCLKITIIKITGQIFYIYIIFFNTQSTSIPDLVPKSATQGCGWQGDRQAF